MGFVRILPCPFCGSREVRVSETTDSHFFVSCDRCEGSGSLTTDREDAVCVWNAAARFRPECRSGDCYAATYDIEGAENDPSCAESGESGRNRDAECRKSQIRCGPTDPVNSPAWYTSGSVETIDKVEAVVAGLPSVQAFLLGQVVRCVDRAGRKDEAAIDLGKANNYAHRLVRGKWRDR